ncbi:hypothetical protein [Pelagibius sp. Alg239-R121]|uniref:hypothetical protein n=1 Tax=Pelagibius sp. Alg239-R121 TaxID=2993448 RepID=UPI0024A6BDCE|nr:hypothetical protein [Pelagibius sp. Alg239-R121]
MDHNFEDKTHAHEVFSSVDRILGVPSTHFIATGAISVVSGVLIAWYFGLFVGLVGFYGLYQLYLLDPEGLVPWRARLMSRVNAWRIGRGRPKSIYFIPD